MHLINEVTPSIVDQRCVKSGAWATHQTHDSCDTVRCSHSVSGVSLCFPLSKLLAAGSDRMPGKDVALRNTIQSLTNDVEASDKLLTFRCRSYSCRCYRSQSQSTEQKKFQATLLTPSKLVCWDSGGIGFAYNRCTRRTPGRLWASVFAAHANFSHEEISSNQVIHEEEMGTMFIDSRLVCAGGNVRDISDLEKLIDRAEVCPGGVCFGAALRRTTITMWVAGTKKRTTAGIPDSHVAISTAVLLPLAA